MASNARRLPRTVPLGPDVDAKIKLASQAVIREVADCEDGEDLDGYMYMDFSDNKHGTPVCDIYIDKALGNAKRWSTYRHELVHALHGPRAMGPRAQACKSPTRPSDTGGTCKDCGEQLDSWGVCWRCYGPESGA